MTDMLEDKPVRKQINNQRISLAPWGKWQVSVSRGASKIVLDEFTHLEDAERFARGNIDFLSSRSMKKKVNAGSQIEPAKQMPNADMSSVFRVFIRHLLRSFVPGDAISLAVMGTIQELSKDPNFTPEGKAQIEATIKQWIKEDQPSFMKGFV